MKDLLDEVNSLLEGNAGDAFEEPTIQEEPELVSFDFLALECLPKDTGRAMAMRNYWAYLCSLP